MDRTLLLAVQPQGQCTELSPDTEDDYPILRREVEAAVQSLKKGKPAGVDNIPAELVQAGGEDVISALVRTCKKIWQTGDHPWTSLWMVSKLWLMFFICASTVLRQVVFGRPRFRFPSGVQWIATLVMEMRNPCIERAQSSAITSW